MGTLTQARILPFSCAVYSSVHLRLPAGRLAEWPLLGRPLPSRRSRQRDSTKPCTTGCGERLFWQHALAPCTCPLLAQGVACAVATSKCAQPFKLPKHVHPLSPQVLGQIHLAQALAPLLKAEPSSSYTVITGRLGEWGALLLGTQGSRPRRGERRRRATAGARVGAAAERRNSPRSPSRRRAAAPLACAGETCTMPDGALFAVANAAVYGIVQALQAEYRGKPQRINEVGSAGQAGPPCPGGAFPSPRLLPGGHACVRVHSLAACMVAPARPMPCLLLSAAAHRRHRAARQRSGAPPLPRCGPGPPWMLWLRLPPPLLLLPPSLLRLPAVVTAVASAATSASPAAAPHPQPQARRRILRAWLAPRPSPSRRAGSRTRLCGST